MRIVAATHRNLARSASARDVPRGPPVPSRRGQLDRSRRCAIGREDIRELVEHFLDRRVRAQSAVAVAPDLRRRRSRVLERYRWPGNVRELAHVVEKLVLFASSEVARAEDVPDSIRDGDSAQAAAFQGAIIPLRELDRRYTAWAVGQTGGHRGKAAEKLAIDPKTLRKLLDGARDDDE